MSEAELERAVRALIKAYGLLGYHPYDSRRSAPGWPDWTIVGPGGLIFRELKSPTGRLSSDQVTWQYTLRAAGADAKVWRPADLHDGTIARELQAIT